MDGLSIVPTVISPFDAILRLDGMLSTGDLEI
jgi:hypothetical protein